MPFADDGDVLILYYRKDIFGDTAIKSAFKAKHGYELRAAEDLEAVQRDRQFPDRTHEAGWHLRRFCSP